MKYRSILAATLGILIGTAGCSSAPAPATTAGSGSAARTPSADQSGPVLDGTDLLVTLWGGAVYRVPCASARLSMPSRIRPQVLTCELTREQVFALESAEQRIRGGEEPRKRLLNSITLEE